MTKIAIPVSNGEAALQFEKSKQFMIYDLSASNSLITARHLENIQNKMLDVIPENLAKQGVNVVITRWIRKDLAKSLCDNKIQLYVGVSTQEPDKLIEMIKCAIEAYNFDSGFFLTI